MPPAPFSRPVAGPRFHEPPPGAVLRETSDAPSTPGTPYELHPGERFEGTIGHSGDRDRVAITLQGGQTYTLRVEGVDGGGGTLSDPLLRLLDSSGQQIALNDNSGSRDAELRFTPDATARYLLEVGGARFFTTGSYTLMADTRDPADLPVASLDELAAYLTHGYWGGTSLAFPTNGSMQVLSVNLTGLPDDARLLARAALELWESVTALRFREVAQAADITFSDDEEGGAFSQSSDDGRVLTSSRVNVPASWVADDDGALDSYAFSTYIHEIGHALGLGHPGPYNFEAHYAEDAVFANDSYQLTVMSYFSQTENPAVTASFAVPITPMMADIVAIQALYGAPDTGSPTAGNTVWGQNGTLPGLMGLLVEGGLGAVTGGLIAGNPVALTIHDRGGRDTLDLRFSTQDNRVSLMPESVSDIGGGIGNLAVARGTILETLLAGAGNDTLSGTPRPERIEGGAGDDSIVALAGDDLVLGQDGADSLAGNAGQDTLYGGAGDDTLSGGEGADLLGAGAGEDSLLGEDGADGLWGGPGDDTLAGGAGDDTLGGGAGDDRLDGAEGDDQIWTAAGDDSAEGGTGCDTIGGAAGNDSLAGGADADEIWGALGHDTLTGGAGDDLLGAASGQDALYGDDGADILFAGTGDDLLDGGADNDTLYGAAGDDTLRGGTGDDTLYGGPGADVFVFTSGDGNDDIGFFSAADDMLRLDRTLWGDGLSAAQVVAQFGSVQGADYVLDFGTGGSLTLLGQAAITGLEGAIDIV